MTPIDALTRLGTPELAPAFEEYWYSAQSAYPGDKPSGTHWYGSNKVTAVTPRKVHYAIDTYGGQSGGPVWIHETETGPPIAVGIHAYGVGGTPATLGITANSAPRIIPEVLEKVREWLAQDSQTGGR